MYQWEQRALGASPVPYRFTQERSSDLKVEAKSR